MWTSLSLNSQRFSCFCSPSAGIKGIHSQTWPPFFFLQPVHSQQTYWQHVPPWAQLTRSHLSASSLELAAVISSVCQHLALSTQVSVSVKEFGCGCFCFFNLKKSIMLYLCQSVTLKPGLETFSDSFDF